MYIPLWLKNILCPVVDVQAQQRRFATLPGPVFLKTAGDKFRYRLIAVVLPVSLAYTYYNMWNMAHGVGRIERH
ncbi:hypothetical protein H696_01025 [Fonticula alba]|uniref:Uncharacterized protein n=1 Tax=Fonticula alba TaxID=691883 RepID=A0A058ZDR7_FONAL|nr:hypothetical protein H696_01025 [Fonticula alba]KCV71607.1 hypothetical protein H696_01025 [Fonticula alba]|eukprot:XP_009493185.1 hypothetical protein H696_01025 [Fonticula alba]